MDRTRPRAAGWRLVVAGLVLVVAGVVFWGYESEYGSGLNFSTTSGPTGRTVVHEEGEDGTPPRQVFEGSEAEAAAFMDERRAEEENLLLPAGVILAGVAVVAAGAVRWRRQRAGHHP